MPIINVVERLETTICCTCGMHFAVPEHWLDKKRETGEGFHCPAGHPLSYGEGTLAKTRRALQAAEARAQQEREQRQAAQRELEKTKARIAGGACPCCKRNFKALRRHMAAKHPDYKGT